MVLRAKSHEGFFPKVPVLATRYLMYTANISPKSDLVLAPWFWSLWLIGDVIFDDVFDLEDLNESKLQELVVSISGMFKSM